MIWITGRRTDGSHLGRPDQPAHVVVLRPLVELLEADEHDVTLTARPLSHTTELLDRLGHPLHGDRAPRRSEPRSARRSRRALETAQAFAFARGKRFDYGLAHGSTDLPPIGRLLRIPNTTMFDYEWARLQHELNCRLATRVLVPDAIPAERARAVRRPAAEARPATGLKEEVLPRATSSRTSPCLAS